MTATRGERTIGLGRARLAVALATSAVLALAAAPVARADASISITSFGFSPQTVTVAAGESINWTNAGLLPQTVTSENGLFDSGEIGPGAGLTVGLAVPGTHVYRSAANPLFVGTIQVVLTQLPGPPGEPVAEHIPDVPFPEVADGDLDLHPRFGVIASRTRVMLGFEDGVTVGEANEALADANVHVLGSLPEVGILLVAPRTPFGGFSTLEATLELLRESAAVEFAAMSMEVGTRVVPRAPESQVWGPPFFWGWEVAPPPAVHPVGTGGNYGLEMSRFPEAWNLMEHIARGLPVHTAIIDAGFEEHPDLGRLLIRTLCTRPLLVRRKCTGTAASDHGNHVAGIIGADFDNDTSPPSGRSLGISGGNPFTRMHGVQWLGDGRNMFGGTVFVADQLLETFNLVLRASGSSLPELRVINFSGGGAVFRSHPSTGVPFWWSHFTAATCGPAQIEFCTPNNEMSWQREFAHLGRKARRVAELALSKDVLIVQAASNDSRRFCQQGPPGNQAGCTWEVLEAKHTTEFAWAADPANWRSGLGPPPILIVEAIDGTKARAAFSDRGGHVSAPGVDIVSTRSASGTDGCTVDTALYCAMSGTSMATPHVSALAGYLLAFDPTLTTAQVRERILNSARADTTGGAAPRIDAFSAVLGLPGAAKALVDVNDPSKDGNRRVVYAPGSIGVAEDHVRGEGSELTAPDGKIDMRDFRRFRDAFLQFCLESDLGHLVCPPKSEIVLDGAPNHPKKDLNFDRCVYVPPADPHGCATRETAYPRFDLNGNREISEGPGFVPLNPDGSPRQDGGGTSMRDLAVLQSQWEPDPADTDGWSASDLDGLLSSGDLELHADAFFAIGADEVEFTFRDPATGRRFPDRTLLREEQFIVATVPSGTVEITAAATVGSEELSYTRGLSLAPGKDVRVDVCLLQLGLRASRDRLPANGTATATIAATLTGCHEDDVSGREVTFSLDTDGPDDASLSPLTAVTDAAGRVQTTFTAGTVAREYAVTAVADFEGETEVSGETRITVVPPLTIAYAWRQEILEWWQEGTTRWPGPFDPLRPDCTGEGVVEYCIDSFRVELDPDASEGLEREGTITGLESSFRLSEEVTTSTNRSTAGWALSDPDGSNTRSGGIASTWLVPPSQRQRYQEHELPPSVSAVELPEGLQMSGLREIGELGYVHSLSGSRFGDGDPEESHVTLGDLLLVPRGDGSAFRLAADMTRPILFEWDGEGLLEPYRFCGTFERDLAAAPGYRITSPFEWIPGLDSQGRKPDYEPGDRPMPVGPGRLRVRYSFVAVASFGGDPAIPIVPDCSVNNPPVADFSFTPASPGEGRVVLFRDRSRDPENDLVSWEWSFGDGTTSTSRDPHHIFGDDGSYTVELTVTDSHGESDTTSEVVTVVNLPPEAEMEDAFGEEGEDVVVTFRLWDPGTLDKQALSYVVTSPSGLFEGSFGETVPAGRRSVRLIAPPVGTHTLLLRVEDKDGEVATDTATVVVRPAGTPPPDPPPPLPPGETCDPAVVLDGEEQAFLERLNAYRAENGLAPVAVSPTLSAAAQRHADDMAGNGFLGHVGSDGSTPEERAREAGYPQEAAIGENVLVGTPLAIDALLSWKSSLTGHNENMLHPLWRAVGIARREGDEWYWSNSFGSVLDCPGGEPPQGFLSGGSDEPEAEPDGAPVLSQFLKMLAWSAQDPDPQPHSSPADEEIRIEAAAAEPEPLDPGLPPMPAFVIEKTSPDQRQPVAFRNVSRDAAGEPLAAVLDPGDDSGTVGLGPGESREHTYESPFSKTVRLTATDGSGRELTARRTISVTPLPAPSLTYTGPTTGFVDHDSTLKAIARRTPGGEPVPGLELTFTIGALEATAVTDADGLAEALVRVSLAAGSYSLVISSAPTEEFRAGSASVSFTVGINNPPVADAGGPYLLGAGNALALDGSRSSDPDPGDQVVSYHWDLSGNGEFGDLTGGTPRLLTWAEVETIVCGGECGDDRSYPIALRVTDTRGATATASTTLTINRDFALFVGPVTALAPGASNSVGVSVVGAAGFTSPVTLSVQALPTGVTASFTPNPIVPSGVSVLTLTAASDVPSGDFDLVVVGEGGGLVRETASEVRVAFGLIPVCHGTVTGTVTDAETGEPIANASVRVTASGGTTVFTNEEGRYTHHRMPLGHNNAPQFNTIEVRRGTVYWEQFLSVQSVCGAVETLDAALVERRFGRAEGRVVVGIPDPADDSSGRRVDPSDTPIPGATIRRGGGELSPFLAFADAEGLYAGTLPLFQNNAPFHHTLRADSPGYWWQTKNVVAQADVTEEVDFELVRRCWARFLGGTVYDTETGEPVPNVRVRLFLPLFNLDRTTGEDGTYSYDRLMDLGYNNSRVAYRVDAIPLAGGPGAQSDSRQLVVSECDAELTLDLFVHVPPPPAENLATVEGFVFDEETGEPVEGADVYVAPGDWHDDWRKVTDASGYYAGQVLVGTGDVTSATRFFYAEGWNAGYWGLDDWVEVELTAGETVRLDHELLRRKPGTLAGTVRDMATGAPLESARVNAGFRGSVFTDESGEYELGNLELGWRNEPITIFAEVTRTGYWPKSVSAVVSGDGVTTLDVDLLKECDTARVVGTVQNASTGEPIQGASVSGGGRFTSTNAAGQFQLTGIRLQHDNTPWNVFVTASAAGFFPQTKVVTVFCGATIVLDFGRVETAFGAVVGTVTEADTGAPVAGAFVGSDFGASATTDAGGHYRLDGAPLGEGNTPRDWNVTVFADGFPPATLEVTVSANTDVRLDFQIGADAGGPPPAEDQEVVTDEDVPVEITLGPDELEYEVVDPPAHGTLSGSGAVLTYTPEADFFGEDSFTFTASLGGAVSEPGTVTITILPVNDPPNARPDEASVLEDGVVVIDVLANDDPGPPNEADQTLTVMFFTEPEHGFALLVGPGLLRYVPAADYNGLDSFTYVVCDDGESRGEPDPRCAVGTVTITVLPVNDPPLAHDGAVELLQGSPPVPIDLGALAEDVETATADLTYTIVAGPAKGTLTETGPIVLYEPHPRSRGEDSFTFTVTDRGDPDGCTPVPVCDPPLTSEPATVSIWIEPVNSPPVVSLLPAGPLPEGGTLDLHADAHDPDDDELTFTWEASDGELTADGPSATLTHPDGPAQVTVRVTVSDGEVDVSDEQVIEVVNVAPTVVARPDATADEGEQLSLTLAAFTDPGVLDTHTASVSWGDGTVESAVVDGAAVLGTHTYLDDGEYTVTVTVTDSDGDSGSGTFTVLVRNVPPTVSAGPDATIDEGDTVALAPATFTDPGVLDTHTATIDWGDGTVATGAVSGRQVAGSHTYLDDGLYTVTVTVTDKDGGVGSDTFLVTVHNVPPTVSAGPDLTIDEGDTVTLAPATFTDPGVLDTHTATIDWGDGSEPQAGVVSGRTVHGSHRFDDDGVYVVTVTVTDKDGGVGSDTFTVTALNVSPTVDAGPGTTAYWGLPVAFAGSIHDPSEADTRAGFSPTWTFGDGSPPAFGLEVTHVYQAPGTYTATLTATDKDGGVGTGSRTVVVEKREVGLEYTGSTEALFGFVRLSARLTDEVDAATARLADREVVFHLDGRTLPARTDSDGVAVAATELPVGPGDHEVTVTFAEDDRYLEAASEPAQLAVLSGPGKVTAGALGTPGNGSAGFVVMSDGTSLHGQLQFQRQGERFHADTFLALGVAADGRSAWFVGVGRDGRPFVAYVEDSPPPGRDDVFRLWISGVLQTPDGPLRGGKIQIHKNP